MYDFSKEVMIANAGSEFFLALEDRLADKTGYGLSDWYADVAWALRLFVDVEVPLFSGKNEATWLSLAEELESRSEFYDGKPQYTVVWSGKEDGAVSWRQSGQTLAQAISLADYVLQIVSVEDADWSGPMPSGERGVNLGEACKLVAMFTKKFWEAELKWSRVPSPHKAWVSQCVKELVAAHVALGEPTVGGDLGKPGTVIPGTIPWSMPE